MEHLVTEFVRCPQCKGSLGAAAESEAPGLACPHCAAIYPVSGGIVDLAPRLTFKRSLAQSLMESPTMVSVYESRLWRRSRWQGGLLGIQFDREADVIMRAAQVKETSTVLDLACGPGIYTRLFARAAAQGRVLGMDLSMPMLEWGAQKAKQEHLCNIGYLRASAPELPFGDRCFDCVNCCGALHLFPEPHQALGEIVRILRPGGRFTAATFRRRESILGRFRSRSAQTIGVSTFTPEGLEMVLSDLGMAKIQIHHDATRWVIMSGEKS